MASTSWTCGRTCPRHADVASKGGLSASQPSLRPRRRCQRQAYAPGLHRQRHTLVVAHQRSQPSADDSRDGPDEGPLLLRLFAASFAGAAVIKYGELLLGDIPFSHNPGLALTMIGGPCVVFSIILASRSR